MTALAEPNVEPLAAMGVEVDLELDRATLEVDRSLIRWMLGLSLRERLRAGSRTTRMLGRFSRVRSSETS